MLKKIILCKKIIYKVNNALITFHGPVLDHEFILGSIGWLVYLFDCWLFIYFLFNSLKFIIFPSDFVLNKKDIWEDWNVF